ncbi:flagella basal body P-ring formation protein FlgA [Halanaerobium saccharolyticum]|uniref:Flagella basal body P-ring formation protein FlgA n=1 Tax=Halanaerobium saccharolyticum TaxID=43595 RepID=A0A4R7YVD5_9FIRM|nr:flagellar basal body P-ring formation chaperone FlgA [Halanaerobium saccharolyticum]RAK08923.1 flagella basal body P-ring formation protein FlgA [Halanaerobium saccharolyticum]TDV98963.1 flagella basal body P-ring formation protein FlgA [Halanaerobium saccharolyticum]TDX60686.1 flagella basal body P-ring formation protein FlgA [Halanaerobium saccharolyticum]
MKKLIIILTVLIFGITTFSAAAFEIKINEEVEVSALEITLAEIAEIRAPELSAAAVEELRNLSFKSSPNPGYQKRLSRVLVELTIQNLGYKKNQFKLQMPGTVIVSRKSSVITEAEIAAQVEDYLKSNLDFEAEQLIIESRSSLNQVEIPAGDYELKVAENQSLSLPNTNVKLEVWQNGEQVRGVFYPVKISLLLEILTASRDLSINSRIKKSDFEIKEQKISGDPEKLIKDWSEIDLNNVRLSRSLKKGDILRSDNLKVPYVVKWGQKLNLRLSVNNIHVSTFVEAKERGRIGEMITVENLNSGYQFQAEVVSPTEVKMISD